MPALFAIGAEALGGLGLFGGGAAAAEGGALAAGALGGAELGGAAGAAAGGGLFEGLGAGAAGLLAEGAGDAFASAGGSSFGGLLEGSGAPSAFGQLGASAGGNAGTLTAIPGAAAVPEAAAGAGASGASALGGAGGIGKAAGEGSSLFGSLLSSAQANPLQAAGLGLGAAGLGYNLMQGQSTNANAKALSGSANQLTLQGQQLASYLQTGTLPEGLKAAVGKANEAAKARAIQNAARSGMPTDPSQNSALAQDLNNIDQQSIIQTSEIGQKLLTTGINEIGLADQLYAQLVNIDQRQAQNTGNAIMNFAGALAGGRQQPLKAAA